MEQQHHWRGDPVLGRVSFEAISCDVEMLHFLGTQKNSDLHSQNLWDYSPHEFCHNWGPIPHFERRCFGVQHFEAT